MNTNRKCNNVDDVTVDINDVIISNFVNLEHIFTYLINQVAKQDKFATALISKFATNSFYSCRIGGESL
jgi:hypothetical protein